MPSNLLPPIITREFQRSRLALFRAGCRTQVAKLDAIQIQAASREEITDAHLTRHGESRLPGAEKFDLGNGYRVITQLVEHEGDCIRVFWFAGSHDECESWLERHRGYTYVFDPRDKKIELVPVDVTIRDASPRLVNPELSPATLDRPLLRHLTQEDWERLGVSEELKGQLLALTHEDYASLRVIDVLHRAPKALEGVLFDVMIASNEEDIDAIRARVALFHGERRRASGAQVLEAIGLPVNAEKFLTFSDPEQLDEFLAREAWESWMLFLHPAQREVVEARFSGPARVRGVSGSGKTSILLHRARTLAKRHGLPVLVVTYTTSLAKLLSHLADTLCGVERNLVTVSTAAQLATDVLWHLDPGFLGSLRHQPSEADLRTLRRQCLDDAKATAALRAAGRVGYEADRSLDDGLSRVREEYLVGERERYVTADEPRERLPASVRAAVIRAAGMLEAELARRKTADDAGLVINAIDAAASKRGDKVDFARPDTIRLPFARCVLVDEAQDLSANELRLLMALTDHTAEDACFLAWDSAQRIFRRNTSLASIGFDVRGRAYVLRKNYRNTLQILRAARLLLEAFNIHELEDTEASGLIDVDLPAREGSLPDILRFDVMKEEVEWVAREIRRIRTEEVGVIGSGIAVLSSSRRHRDAVQQRLRGLGIPVEPLRNDVVASSGPVKLSTIESAKGHEFSIVFLVGMMDDVIPQADASEAETRRDASRLYVAMTRARDRVVLTWNRQDGSRASRFLTTMMAACAQARCEAGRIVSDA